MESAKQRITNISNIRVLAIFIVVLGHSIILYSSGWNVYQTIWNVPFLDGLKKIINMIQMPLFFSLSGYLFVFTHGKKRGMIQLLKSKAKRLLLPYCMIGLFFMVPLRLLIHYPGYEDLSAKKIVSAFFDVTDVGHLWFLPALFLMFVLADILLWVAEKIPGLCNYAEIGLALGAAFIFLEGYRFHFGYGPLQTAYIHLIWFVWGYLLNVWQGTVARLYSRRWISMTLVAANILLIVVAYRTDMQGLLIPLAVRGLTIMNVYGLMPGASCPVAKKLDRNSFGIYLFHSPLIYITYTLIPNVFPGIVVFINLVVCGAVAYGLTNLVRRAHLGFVIGE